MNSQKIFSYLIIALFSNGCGVKKAHKNPMDVANEFYLSSEELIALNNKHDIDAESCVKLSDYYLFVKFDEKNQYFGCVMQLN